MEKSIKALFKDHSGKVTDKWKLYLEEWDRIFEPYRTQSINLLEIGIQNGGSLEVWSEGFSRAQRIVGCDIEEKCRNLHYQDERISVIVGDANCEETRRKILAESPRFDIIIDDGSHVSSDVIRSFSLYFSCLSDGGTYLIEDLHTSYWQEFEGGLFYPFSSFAFLKKLVDILNHEHWNTSTSRSSLLNDFTQILGIDFDEQALAQIHSIEFLNSLCIIKKQPEALNLLGERMITGSEAIVEQSVLTTQGKYIQEVYPSDKVISKESAIETGDANDQGKVVQELAAQIGNLNLKIAQLEHAIEGKQNEITDYASSTSWRITKPFRQISNLLKKRA